MIDWLRFMPRFCPWRQKIMKWIASSIVTPSATAGTITVPASITIPVCPM